MWWLIWLGAALVLGMLELLTMDFFFLTLALAAIVAGGFGAFGGGVAVQVIAFAVAAVVLLVLVRPWARRLLQNSTPDIDTNARAYLGKTAVVMAPLIGEEGRVRIGGEVWSARGQDGATFPVGSEVRVVQIDGATAVVGPFSEQVALPPSSVPLEPEL